MRIFFAGPLTDLRRPAQTKAFYKKMARVAKGLGAEYYWAFLRGTDPEENPDVSPSRVYQIDTYELEKSDIMVAYMGEPSTGTGIEIEFARTKKIPVYLLYPKGTRVSRMIRGCPAIKEEIAYSSETDGLRKLEALLKRLTRRYP